MEDLREIQAVPLGLESCFIHLHPENCFIALEEVHSHSHRRSSPPKKDAKRVPLVGGDLEVSGPAAPPGHLALETRPRLGGALLRGCCGRQGTGPRRSLHDPSTSIRRVTGGSQHRVR